MKLSIYIITGWIVGLRHQTPATQSARNILLVFLVLALVSTGFRWHQGTLVSISQEKENWYEIELSDGKKGWTLKSNIAG